MEQYREDWMGEVEDREEERGVEEREEERGVGESRHGQEKGCPRTALCPFLQQWKHVETS